MHRQLSPFPKGPKSSFLFVVSLCLLAMLCPFVQAQLAVAQPAEREVQRPAVVTSETLESRIAATEAATDLPEKTKTDLLDLYRDALSNLQVAGAHAERTAVFSEAARTATIRIQLIRERLEAFDGSDPLLDLRVSAESPLDQIEQQLQIEQADLAAATVRQTELDEQLAGENKRPGAIRQRLAEASRQREDIAAVLRLDAETNEQPLLAQAKRWVLETRDAALSAEVKMLDQELLTRPVREDLLEARRDQEAGRVARTDRRIRELSELVDRKRRLDAEEATAEVEQMQQVTAGSDPLLIRLAERNAELTDDLNAMTTRLIELDRLRAMADELGERIRADYEDARSAVEGGRRTEGLGEVFVAHRDSLPDARVYADRAQAREQEIDATVVRRLRHREEARRTEDTDLTFAELEAQLDRDESSVHGEQLRALIEQRRDLLEKALEADDYYLARLRELHAAEQKLVTLVRAYDSFLMENLLWLGSVQPTRLEDFSKLPVEVATLLSPTTWSNLARTLVDQVAHSPAAWLALLLIAVLFWKQRALLVAVEAISTQVGKPSTDRFSYTLRALALTLIAAAPLPLLLITVGWQIQAAGQDNDTYQALGLTLARVAMTLYVLRALDLVSIPRGLAAAHFKWKETRLQLIRVELRRLTWVWVVAILVLRLAIDLNPTETGGLIARLGVLVALAALTLFFYRVLHPNRGVLAYLRQRKKPGFLIRAYNLWFPLVLILPLGLAVLPLLGFMYSLFTIGFVYLDSLLAIMILILARAIALRWLLLVRRRLSYEAALERRKAKLEARETSESGVGETMGGVIHLEEPEVDLDSLSGDTRELLDVAIVAGGLVLLYLIWAPLLPALRVFDTIDLWYYAVSVDGKNVHLPITLADLALALLYAIGVGVLAKRLPALLEIILLRRFDVSAGSRYTIVTITNYAIIVVGVLLVFNTIGAEWSQLQWLVAALGVGIGFGLQEIVANFISGLIILFERPIRIGDIVTVGDTDGVVTKIQIRATTIRNWDYKELLVPNKEFITGRLLNWSLSDPVTRIVIVVGIAYGSDVDKALALMREAAEENEQVLQDPTPILSFEGFGDNSLTLLLRAYVANVDARIPTITALHRAINRKFESANINIAFPQRDLHLDTNSPLRISIEKSQNGHP